MYKALFLDRDGVINFDKGYVYLKEDFEFIEGIFDLCKVAKTLDFKIIIVTNQAGIGRGYYTITQFNNLTDWMCNRFLQNDILIDKVYFSPFHPTHGLGKFKKDDYSRKPNPGMIKLAETEFNLDLSKSILIGDKYTDILAGKSAGVGRNILVAPKPPKELNENDYILVQRLEEIVFL